MATASEIRALRLEKINLLREHGYLSYPAKTTRTHTIAEASANADALIASTQVITLAGRIMSIRAQGGIIFAHLFDGTAVDTRFQILLKKGEPISEKAFDLFKQAIDIGDFIQATGTVFVTNRGEKTVLVTEWSILTKTLLPLPDKFHGIQDEEEKLRKRYLDILFSPDLQNMIRIKATFWQEVRSYLIKQGFIEVDTPTLELTTGGAEATPFRTHHNDYDLDVYLRISIGELWQKRLLAAGLPRTFEIGRAYRNEGTSPEHAQEFTNIEFYAAYMDYEQGMKFTENMLKTVIQNTFGTSVFNIKNFTGIDFNSTWKHIDYAETILQMTGIDISTATDDEIKTTLRNLHVDYTGQNRERLTDTLWKYCRKQIAGPVWLINHPTLVSPLAKPLEHNPEKVQRVQLIVAGAEVTNGFSELNDPIDQHQRFENQKKLIEMGDQEAMMPDHEFVEMLEYGMPPAFGQGFGERFLAFLLNKPLREMQLFPIVRPKKEEDK